MASKKAPSRPRNKFLATLVTGERLPCAFCQREIDDELTYGKLYAIGDIQVHYFCVLLSCCLVQKGKDTEGLFGFLYPDIIAELERSKKHKCSYCGMGGAALGCSVSQCRKQFHLPCGREKNAVSLFYGNYKSFCQQHVPKQKIPEHIMEQVRIRKKQARMSLGANTSVDNLKAISDRTDNDAPQAEMVCVICYEEVDAFPTVNTFWPPCCARDAWFHRACLQRMALSAGIHYLKCPLCNDKDHFYDAVASQGYYVPDRDAAWELEQNAFAEIYERPSSCSAEACLCPKGREHDADTGDWDIKLCILCGTSGCHAACLTANDCPLQKPRPTSQDEEKMEGQELLCDSIEDSNDSIVPVRYVCSVCTNCAPEDLDSLATRIEADIPLQKTTPISQGEDKMEGQELLCDSKEDSNDSIVPVRYVCSVCTNCAPEDLDSLATRIEAVILTEQRASQQRVSQLIMPSRMSLRRTKGQTQKNVPSTSQNNGQAEVKTETTDEIRDQKPNTTAARLELNLKPPRKPSTNYQPLALKPIENSLFSPTKLIQENLSKKIRGICMESVKEQEIIMKVKEELKKPGPLSVKKKIVNSALERLFDDIFKETLASKSSPKKTRKEIAEKTEQKASAQNTPENLPKGRKDKILPSVEVAEKLPNGRKFTCIEDAKLVEEDETKKIDINDSLSFNSSLKTPESITKRKFDDGPPIMVTPKKLKTVDILKDSSLEISENDEIINVNVVKMEEKGNKDFIKVLKIPLKTEKCALKFNPKDKECLVENDVNIDMDSFKSHYLNEVGRDFKSNLIKIHSPIENSTSPKISITKDVAYEDFKQNKTDDEKTQLKRKLDSDDVIPKKKLKKKKGIVLKYKKNPKNIEVICSNDIKNTESIDFTIEAPKQKKKLKTLKKIKRNRVSNNIQVKIRFKPKQVKLKITNSTTKTLKKDKKKISKPKLLTQYVLNVCDNADDKIIAKPDQELTPQKRKYVKSEKSPDNLVQTSIQNFFKKVPCETKVKEESSLIL